MRDERIKALIKDRTADLRTFAMSMLTLAGPSMRL
jgi:hypothetical protein